MTEELLDLLLQILVVVCVALLSVAFLFVSWHRWKFPRGHERILAFFHPHCAAAGGGERVLWAILQALGEIDQQGLPIQKVVIYTIDPPSQTYKNGEFRSKSSQQVREKSCGLCYASSLELPCTFGSRLISFFLVLLSTRRVEQGEGEVPAFHTVHTGDIFYPFT
jgi:ALG11 mannosyltransferase N-terminus